MPRSDYGLENRSHKPCDKDLLIAGLNKEVEAIMDSRCFLSSSIIGSWHHATNGDCCITLGRISGFHKWLKNFYDLL